VALQSRDRAVRTLLDDKSSERDFVVVIQPFDSLAPGDVKTEPVPALHERNSCRIVEAQARSSLIARTAKLR
jgi:hypothetical protein